MGIDNVPMQLSSPWDMKNRCAKCRVASGWRSQWQLTNSGCIARSELLRLQAPLALQNKKLIYTMLLHLSAETLIEMARSPKHLCLMRLVEMGKRWTRRRQDMNATSFQQEGQGQESAGYIHHAVHSAKQSAIWTFGPSPVPRNGILVN
jgi:hypothetical protein